MDKKGALEVLCLAEDLYGFDASGGRRVIFFSGCSNFYTNALVDCLIEL